MRNIFSEVVRRLRFRLNAQQLTVKRDAYTGGIPNGYWLDSVDKCISSAYILGVADGLYARRANLDDPLCRDNPRLNRENVVEIVRIYYQKDPENKFRQIAAVIRSGCL